MSRSQVQILVTAFPSFKRIKNALCCTPWTFSACFVPVIPKQGKMGLSITRLSSFIWKLHVSSLSKHLDLILTIWKRENVLPCYRPLLEEIVIQVRVESISQLRLSFDYQILRNEERVAIGTTSHCFLNASFKPIPIPPDILRRLRGDLSKEFVNDGVGS